MRASGVNAAIMRIIGKLEQKKMRAIWIARIGVARVTLFYCKYEIKKMEKIGIRATKKTKSVGICATKNTESVDMSAFKIFGLEFRQSRSYYFNLFL